MFSGNGRATSVYRNSIKESTNRQLEECPRRQRRCNEYNVGCRKHGCGSVVWRDSRANVAIEPFTARNAPYSEARGDYGSVASKLDTPIDSSIRLIYVCLQTKRRIQFQTELNRTIKGVRLVTCAQPVAAGDLAYRGEKWFKGLRLPGVQLLPIWVIPAMPKCSSYACDGL
jgi:hypothetical protein